MLTVFFYDCGTVEKRKKARCMTCFIAQSKISCAVQAAVFSASVDTLASAIGDGISR